jgi:hypothetical protein
MQLRDGHLFHHITTYTFNETHLSQQRRGCSKKGGTSDENLQPYETPYYDTDSICSDLSSRKLQHLEVLC